MNPQTPITEATAKPKKGGKQPAHHAPKSRAASALRRKKILKAILDGKDHVKAGIESGLSPKTAGSQVAQILAEPKFKNSLLEALAKRGMNNDYFAEHHQALIEGTKVISANIIVKGSETDLKDADSISKNFIEIPDLQAKAKGLEMIYKLTGRFTEKHEVDIKRPLTIVIRKFCSRTEPDGAGTQDIPA